MGSEGVGRKVDRAGRDLIRQMMVAGHSSKAVASMLETEGYAPLSVDHIQRYYGHLPEVVKGREEAAARAVEEGVGERSERLKSLWKRAQWIDDSIGKLQVADVSPTVLKTLLSEFREYSKQMAQELGEWQEKRDVTSGGKPIAFNWSALSTDEVAELERLRVKLGG